MIRSHDTKDVQKHRWVALNDQQLSQVQGGFVFHNITWQVAPDTSPTASGTNYQVELEKVRVTSYG